MDVLPIVIKAWGDIISLHPALLYFFIGSLILCCGAFLLKLASSGRISNFKYKSRGRLFSDAEHSFFLVLKQTLSDEYEVFAKVRIADILTPDHVLKRKNWNAAFYKISSKHFDYVLCDKKTLIVVAVIELDDKSHNQSKTRIRDIFVERACESANLKLIRFPCRTKYSSEAIRISVFNSLELST